jgi:hypothetical protein
MKSTASSISSGGGLAQRLPESTQPRMRAAAVAPPPTPWRRTPYSSLPQSQGTEEEEEEYYDEEYYEEEEIDFSKPFPAEIPMDPNSKTLAAIPLALYYPLVLALAAGGAFVGQGVGRGMPSECFGWLAPQAR